MCFHREAKYLLLLLLFFMHNPLNIRSYYDNRQTICIISLKNIFNQWLLTHKFWGWIASWTATCQCIVPHAFITQTMWVFCHVLTLLNTIAYSTIEMEYVLSLFVYCYTCFLFSLFLMHYLLFTDKSQELQMQQNIKWEINYGNIFFFPEELSDQYSHTYTHTRVRARVIYYRVDRGKEVPSSIFFFSSSSVM